MAVQRSAQLLSSVPILGNPIKKASEKAIADMGNAAGGIANEMGGGAASSAAGAGASARAALGDFVAKDVAAAWAAPMMAAGEAETLLLARDGYIGKVKDVWLDRREAARHTADAMSMEVSALLEPD